MKLGALSKRAVAVGVPAEELEAAQDEDSPKAAVMALILARDPTNQLRTELQSLKLGALSRRAIDAGVDEDDLTVAQDDDAPKVAIIDLILKAEMSAPGLDPTEQLRTELQCAKLGELSRRATAAGVDADELTTAQDDDAPKVAIIELIIQAEGAKMTIPEGIAEKPAAPRETHSGGASPFDLGPDHGQGIDVASAGDWVLSPVAAPILSDYAPALSLFGSMRFPVPEEARVLFAALEAAGVYLKIVDMKAGQDIDKEVYESIEHCDTFFVLGTKTYGEDTGNSACTYNELKFAQGKHKRIILLRMIPWDEDFEELQARVLFNRNMLTLDWQQGTPMPATLIGEIVKALDLPTGGTASPSHAATAEAATAQAAAEIAEAQAEAGKVRAAALHAAEQVKAAAAAEMAELTSQRAHVEEIAAKAQSDAVAAQEALAKAKAASPREAGSAEPAPSQPTTPFTCLASAALLGGSAELYIDGVLVPCQYLMGPPATCVNPIVATLPSMENAIGNPGAVAGAVALSVLEDHRFASRERTWATPIEAETAGAVALILVSDVDEALPVNAWCSTFVLEMRKASTRVAHIPVVIVGKRDAQRLLLATTCTLTSAITSGEVTPAEVVATMKQHADSRLTQKMGMFALLLKAATEAPRLAARGAGAIKVAVAALRKFSEHADVQIYGAILLGRITADSQPGKDEARTAGGLQALVDAMGNFGGDEQPLFIISNSLAAMTAKNPPNKQLLLDAGCIELALGMLTLHKANPRVCHAGAFLMNNLANNEPRVKQSIVEAGGIEAILGAMRMHGDKDLVQRYCCGCLLQFTSLALAKFDSGATRTTVANSDAIALLTGALARHTDAKMQEYGSKVLIILEAIQQGRVMAAPKFKNGVVPTRTPGPPLGGARGPPGSPGAASGGAIVL